MEQSTEKKQFEYLLAKWLMQLREEKGLSQESLGVQLEKGQSDIAKIENGSKKVNVSELVAWMTALNVPLERLNEILQPFYEKLLYRQDYLNRKNGRRT